MYKAPQKERTCITKTQQGVPWSSLSSPVFHVHGATRRAAVLRCGRLEKYLSLLFLSEPAKKKARKNTNSVLRSLLQILSPSPFSETRDTHNTRAHTPRHPQQHVAQTPGMACAWPRPLTTPSFALLARLLHTPRSLCLSNGREHKALPEGGGKGGAGAGAWPRQQHQATWCCRGHAPVCGTGSPCCACPLPCSTRPPFPSPTPGHQITFLFLTHAHPNPPHPSTTGPRAHRTELASAPSFSPLSGGPVDTLTLACA